MKADVNISVALDIPPTVYADYVLEAKLGWRQQGLKTALVTLVRIDGSSPRPVGSQMAVCEDGRSVGAITGGCAEKAIVLDAVSALARNRNSVELYGKGSRFRDIVLPCGSGIHVSFDVRVTDADLERLVADHRARRHTVYGCETADGVFERAYPPKSRLVIFGSGNIVPYLAQISSLGEYETWVLSPDGDTLSRAAPYASVAGLRSCDDWDFTLVDASTALVSLFHDHDFETLILDHALRSSAFYIGALGSRRAHEARRQSLGRLGWRESDLARIHGPVGLDIGAKTPPEIAISVMAGIVARHRARI